MFMNEYMHDWPENKIIFQTERLEILRLKVVFELMSK